MDKMTTVENTREYMVTNVLTTANSEDAATGEIQGLERLPDLDRTVRSSVVRTSALTKTFLFSFLPLPTLGSSSGKCLVQR
jgi:hypothetical protein